jgi:hypothetical protein
VSAAARWSAIPGGVGGFDALYVAGHGAVVDARFIQDERSWLFGYRPGDGRVERM